MFGPLHVMSTQTVYGVLQLFGTVSRIQITILVSTEAYLQIILANDVNKRNIGGPNVNLFPWNTVCSKPNKIINPLDNEAPAESFSPQKSIHRKQGNT